MTNPASQLSPPTLHWGTVGPDGDRCDVCRAIIKPYGDCFISVRRAFELQQGRMVESEPIRVLMCVPCGWTRPYAPTPRETAPNPSDTANGPQEPDTDAGGASDALPAYHDHGVMD